MGAAFQLWRFGCFFGNLNFFGGLLTTGLQQQKKEEKGLF